MRETQWEDKYLFSERMCVFYRELNMVLLTEMWVIKEGIKDEHSVQVPLGKRGLMDKKCWKR